MNPPLWCRLGSHAISPIHQTLAGSYIAIYIVAGIASVIEVGVAALFAAIIGLLWIGDVILAKSHGCRRCGKEAR